MKMIIIISFGISLPFFSTYAMHHSAEKPIPLKKYDPELPLTSPSSSPKTEGSKIDSVKRPDKKPGCLFCSSEIACDLVNSEI